MSTGTSKKSRDGLLALYYEGGGAALFDPIEGYVVRENIDRDLCEAVLKTAPENTEALSYLSALLTRGGEYEKGLELDLRLLRLRPLSPRVHYNLACTYALLGRTDDAFRSLNKAAEYGFTDSEHMVKDDDLKSLRDDPRFEALVDSLGTADEPELDED